MVLSSVGLQDKVQYLSRTLAEPGTDRKDSRSQVGNLKGGGRKNQVRERRTGERLGGMGISERALWFSTSCEKSCLSLEELGRDADLSSPGLWRLRGASRGPASPIPDCTC